MARRPRGQQAIWPEDREASRPFGQKTVRPAGHLARRPRGQQAIWPEDREASRPYGQKTVRPAGPGNISKDNSVTTVLVKLHCLNKDGIYYGSSINTTSHSQHI